MRKFVYVSGVVFLMIWALASLFKMMHWPGANILLMASALVFVVFVPAAAWYRYHKTS